MKGDAIFDHILRVCVHDFDQHSFLLFVLNNWHLKNLLGFILDAALVLADGVQLGLENVDSALALLGSAVKLDVELFLGSVEHAQGLLQCQSALGQDSIFAEDSDVHVGLVLSRKVLFVPHSL